MLSSPGKSRIDSCLREKGKETLQNSLAFLISHSLSDCDSVATYLHEVVAMTNGRQPTASTSESGLYSWCVTGQSVTANESIL